MVLDLTMCLYFSYLIWGRTTLSLQFRKSPTRGSWTSVYIWNNQNGMIFVKTIVKPLRDNLYHGPTFWQVQEHIDTNVSVQRPICWWELSFRSGLSLSCLCDPHMVRSQKHSRSSHTYSKRKFKKMCCLWQHTMINCLQPRPIFLMTCLI